MNSTELFYFTGTGNTLALTIALGKILGSKISPIAAFRNTSAVVTTATMVGILFPVYYCDAPALVKDFVSKLQDVSGKYIFAIANYGGASGKSFRTIEKSLNGQGGGLSAQFGIHMPQNSFRKPWENNRRLSERGEKKLERFADRLLKRKLGMPLMNKMYNALLRPLEGKLIDMTKKHFTEVANVGPNYTITELVHLADISFQLSDSCNGCETCEKICPTNNIIMVSSKPVWQHRCENCLACINFCPMKAITEGPGQSNYYYKHHALKIDDLLTQKCGTPYPPGQHAQ